MTFAEKGMIVLKQFLKRINLLLLSFVITVVIHISSFDNQIPGFAFIGSSNELTSVMAYIRLSLGIIKLLAPNIVVFLLIFVLVYIVLNYFKNIILNGST